VFVVVLTVKKIFFKIKFQCFEICYFNGSSDKVRTFLRNGSSTAGIPREGTSYRTPTVIRATEPFMGIGEESTSEYNTDSSETTTDSDL